MRTEQYLFLVLGEGLCTVEDALKPPGSFLLVFHVVFRMLVIYMEALAD